MDKKNIIFFVAVFFAGIVFLANNALAGSARLNWNANTEADLAGYKVYYDTASHAGTCPTGYANSIEVPTSANTGYWFDNLTPGQTYYFQVTAYDTSANESGCSTNPGEVSKTITYRGDIIGAMGPESSPNHAVDIYDYSFLRDNFSSEVCGPENKADIDRDCDVDIYDYSILRDDFGNSF